MKSGDLKNRLNIDYGSRKISKVLNKKKKLKKLNIKNHGR